MAHPQTGDVFAMIFEDSSSANDDILERHLTNGTSTWSSPMIVWPGPVPEVTYEPFDIAPMRYSLPSAPKLWPEDGQNQIAFNNIRQATSTPIFRISATSPGGDMNRFQIELNTMPDFSGTFYLETFSGTFQSDVQYNFQIPAGLLPTTSDAIYYVRARASTDGGETWGAWSTENHPVSSFAFKKKEGYVEWFQTEDAQFSTNNLINTETTGAGSVRISTGGEGVGANLLVSIATTSEGSADTSWTTVPGLSANNVCVQGSDSVLLLIAQVQLVGAADNNAEFRFSVNGSSLGSPVLKVFSDAAPMETGNLTLTWAIDGLSGCNNSFEVQWRAYQGTPSLDTSRPRTFQVIEIPAGLAEIVVNQSSYNSASAPAEWGNLFTGTAKVNGPESVLLMIANVPMADMAGDQSADFQFAVDGEQKGAITSAWIDSADADGETFDWSGSFAITGLSAGTHEFSLKWKQRTGTPAVDINRLRTFQVIELKYGAKLKLDLSATSSGSAPSSFANVPDLSGSYLSSGTSSLHLILANMVPYRSDGADANADFRLAINDNPVGATLVSFSDAAEMVQGVNLIWAVTDLQGYNNFSLQWQSIQGPPSTDPTRPRTLQAIEITPVPLGVIESTPIRFSWFRDRLNWGMVDFSTDETNGDVKVKIYYTASTTCDRPIPDSHLPGNNSGFDVKDSPIDLSQISTSTYQEICLKATLYDIDGTPYLTEWAILPPPNTIVSSSGEQISSVLVGSQNVYLGGKFVIRETERTLNLTKIVVSEKGTVEAQTELSNAKLFYDLDTTYPYDCESEGFSGQESQFGTTTSFDSLERVVFEDNVEISPTKAFCGYLVVDVGSNAQEGKTIEIEISKPTKDVEVSFGLAGPAGKVEIEGTTLISGSALLQSDFRWYQNQDSILPGPPLAGENMIISDVKVDDVLRLRINILVSQGSLQASSTQFKVQYGQGTNCAQISEWVDVDSIEGSADGAFFRGFDNPSVLDGTTITTTILSSSNVGLSYEEENPTVPNPNQVLEGQRGEFDFVILNYGAPPETSFCFRIVRADGTPLEGYINYPRLVTGTRGGWSQTKKNEFDQGVLENVTTTETGEVVLSKVCPDGDLILNGATTTLSGEKYYCNVRLTNGAVLYTSSTEILKIHAISIYIDSTSRIDGDGRGYPGAPRTSACGEQNNGQGPGAGTGGYATVNDNGPGGGGGGYGGAGGNGGGAAILGGRDFYEGIGGSTYGSSSDDSLYLGSGGGAGGDSCRSGTTGYGGAGGAGGGAVLLDAETIEIAGTITMKGQNGEAGILGDTTGTGGGGGGSGGTILIKGKNVVITGTLDVRGGNGGARSPGGTGGGAGGGGGGGRIKIFAESLDDELATYLYSGGINGGPSGGTPAAQDGQAGTLFVQQTPYISAMYPDSGKIASQVFDTTYEKAAFIKLSWMEELPEGCDITFEVRASNSSFSKDSSTPDWVSLGTQNSPVTSSLPVGRYKQWRATLTSCQDRTQTPILKEVLVVYDSAPPPITISGTIYMDEGENVLHASPTVSIAVNENFVTSTVASSTSGFFSFIIESPSAGDTIFVFLEDETYKGVTVTHYPGTGDITDLDIYQNRLVLRHHDSNPIKNSDLAKFDKTKNSHITYQVSSGNLTIDPDQRLFIFPNSTFKPEGNVTTLPGALSSQVGGDIKISSGATFDAENYTISCGGDWINYGSFSKTSGQTVIFTATTTGFSINNGSSHFENLIFNGSGGSWQFLNPAILDRNLEVLAGTLTGDQDISIFGGNVTGNGEINLTDGTFLIDGTGNFGGNSNWRFYHLTFGDGSGSGTISATGTGEIIVEGNFTIASGQTLSGTKNFKVFGNVEGDGQINLSQGEFLVDGNGNFGGATNWTFYNLTFGDGESPQATINFVSTNSINVTNDLVINAYQKIQGSKNFNVYGSLTGEGQIEMTGETVMVDGENFGSNSNWIFYNLTFGDGIGTQTTQKTGTGNIEVRGVLTISANQTLNASSQEWILSGSGTPFCC